MKKRQVIVNVVFLVLGVVMLMYIMGNGEKKDDKENTTKVQYFPVDKVNNTDVVRKISSHGKIKTEYPIDLMTEVQGKLYKGSVPLKKGTKFRKGQILGRIDATEFTLSLMSRRSSFINIIANILPDIKLDYNDQFDKWNDYMNSIVINKPLPKLPSWEDNKEKIFLVTRNIVTEYLSIKSLEESEKKYVIIAPYSGEFTDVFVSPNALVTPGMRIASIARTSNFELTAPFTNEEVNTIKNTEFIDVLSSDGKIIGKGNLARVGGKINSNTQMVDVYFNISPLEGVEFYNDMFVRIEVDSDTLNNVFLLPRQAVKDDSVFVLIDSALVKKPILQKFEHRDYYYVKGLKQNDIVVTDRVENYSDTLKTGGVFK